MLKLEDLRPNAAIRGILVKSDVARRQLEAEAPDSSPGGNGGGTSTGVGTGGSGTAIRGGGGAHPPEPARPRRFHGTKNLDPARVGRDASQIADEVIAHLIALVGATVTVTLEIEAQIPAGAPDNVVRTVTENSRTLKFSSHGFEEE